MNRIVSKRELSLWLVIWAGAIALAVAMAMVLVNVKPADAAAQKFVVDRREVWSSIRNYAAPNPTPSGTHLESYTVTITTNYQFWPSNDVNRIAVKGGSVCYHRNAGNGTLFQGVNANPVWMDDNTVVNHGAIEVSNDGTGDNCQNFGVGNSDRRWMRMDQDVAWWSTGKVRIKFTNDDDFDFKWGGSTTRYFHPGDDPDISDWYFCDCAYGS